MQPTPLSAAAIARADGKVFPPALSQPHRVGRTLLSAGLLLGWLSGVRAGPLALPNASFESPAVPPVSPYASPALDAWQKSSQPAWYDPSRNNDTPWAYLMGAFYNVQFPGQFIDNCDGTQAAFLFAVPGAALFQDYDSVSGTNSTPDHAFNAIFNVGSSYDLTVGVIGGGGGMKPGVTLALSFYYRDATGQRVSIAATSLTNSTTAFPTNTHFVDFQVHLPPVQATDAWAGRHLGVQIASTVGFDIPGGYWDLDNVRLQETAGLSLSHPTVANHQLSFTVQSEPGVKFEVQATTDLAAGAVNWTSLGAFTNASGVFSFTDTATNLNGRYYRAHQLP